MPTMFVQARLHVRAVAWETVHGVWVCPLGEAGLGLGRVLHAQTAHLHAVYIHTGVQSS